MKDLRPLRTLIATVASVAALVVSPYAGQDLWHYWQAISSGYMEWARSSQGLWMLTCGIAEVAGTLILLGVAAQALGSKPLLPRAAQTA
jgi:hypothetical protein